MRPGSSNIGRGGGHLRRDARCGAFTLVEVILAIAIATGLLVIALTFYRQATDLRGRILVESERLSVVRLVSDRLTADLRQARPVAGDAESFAGGSGSVRFTRAALAIPSAHGSDGAVSVGPDVVRVSYDTVTGPDGTNIVVLGLDRTESPLSARPRAKMPASAAPLDASVLAPVATNGPAELLTDQVRFIRFRFWDGGAWQESWTNQVPPPGVEVVLGTEPLPDDATPETYPYEQFRRVVVVPAGSARHNDSTNTLSASVPTL